MKSIYIYSVKLFLSAILLSISVISNSQDNKLSRQERKEVRKAELAANFNTLGNMLEDKSFVLEAYFLSNQYGDRISVTPNLNFIKVNSSRGILQTGILSSLGYNGVGGVTTEGNIGKWEINKDVKNMSYFLRFTLHTTLGTFDISMNVNAGNHARATITGITPGKLIYDGQLQTVEQSRVYKGSNSI